MKSFSSSSFASDNAVALELAADAVKDNPYALFTDFQWFLLTGKDTVFFTAFSKTRFDKEMVENTVEQKMVELGAEKRKIAESALGRDTTVGKKLTMEDVDALLATPAGGAIAWDEV